MSHLDITTPDELPDGTTRLGPLVAWGFKLGTTEIWVWHWCDHNKWAGREHFMSHRDEYLCWRPTGIAAHTEVSRDPLHLEPSLYWPDCCGLHGFVRNGRWEGV